MGVSAITREDIVGGTEATKPLSVDEEVNLHNLLIAVNALQDLWGSQFVINSGRRLAPVATPFGTATHSAHMVTAAVDIKDSAQLISKWLEVHTDILEQLGLYMEDPKFTPTWCHVQVRPTHNRIFKPY